MLECESAFGLPGAAAAAAAAAVVVAPSVVAAVASGAFFFFFLSLFVALWLCVPSLSFVSPPSLPRYKVQGIIRLYSSWVGVLLRYAKL